MERLKAYFFLILIVASQYAATGYTYFVNSCSTSGITTVTSSKVVCRCDTNKTIKTAHRLVEEELKKKCCSSIEHFVDGTDNQSDTDVYIDVDLNDDVLMSFTETISDKLDGPFLFQENFYFPPLILEKTSQSYLQVFVI